jgi:uncharacterized secreted protein with C-terminal beta-propeller domain
MVINTKIAFAIISILALLVAGGAIVRNYLAPDFDWQIPVFNFQPKPQPQQTMPAAGEVSNLKKFSSLQDFKQYIEAAQALAAGGDYSFGGGVLEATGKVAITATPPSAAPQADNSAGGQTTAIRVSDTNVQVLGIDEPDIVKTNGQQIYFSQSAYNYWRGVALNMPYDEAVIAPQQYKYNQGGVKIIKALPLDDMAVTGKIDQQGDLLLAGNSLVVLAGEKVYGYDVSDPKNPAQKWKLGLEYPNYLAGARLKDNKLYLITKQYIDMAKPCPFKPVTLEKGVLEIKCENIYHPLTVAPVDSTFTAMEVNPVTGQINRSVSFVGSSNQSTLYVSDNAIYLTYSYQGDTVAFLYNFFKEKAGDLAPDWLMEKISKLMTYDLSQSSKMSELSSLLSRHINSLSEDERMKFNNELTNRMQDYTKEHLRELEKTGIAKIGLTDFKVAGVGAVAGHPLNQFSLDEYQGYLRIAVTVGGQWYPWSHLVNLNNSNSVNDVYILDSSMKLAGSVLDMGLGERVYSARFLGNRGYVVTFKQTDPFYVLDLSNPQKPEKKGELKIPGYSSYLHPLADNIILGLGKEGQQVKLSLFDVKNPASPQEISKYTLDEYWSEILNTHHAFLQDQKHQVFFLPGGKGGYVFSYKGNQLSLTKAVSSIQAKRALYINDYLYIISEDKITVLNETTWEKSKELDL